MFNLLRSGGNDHIKACRGKQVVGRRRRVAATRHQDDDGKPESGKQLLHGLRRGHASFDRQIFAHARGKSAFDVGYLAIGRRPLAIPQALCNAIRD